MWRERNGGDAVIGAAGCPALGTGGVVKSRRHELWAGGVLTSVVNLAVPRI